MKKRMNILISYNFFVNRLFTTDLANEKDEQIPS